jgi:LysM repeat protein
MRRLIVLPVAAAVLVVLAPGCGSEPTGAADTLPPIKTTTTTSTTTTTPDSRRVFYEVKAGDNLNDIARRWQVPAQAIVELNNLSDGGETLQIGQILEKPLDVLMQDTLPPVPSSSTSEP